MEGAATENSVVPVAVVPEAAAVDADPRVDGTAAEDSSAPVVAPEAGADANVDQCIEDANATPGDGKHGDTMGDVDVTPEEMRSIIEVIADTGKFWHDWSFLKRLLSLQLKQGWGGMRSEEFHVLAEYFEAQMVSREDGQQQNSLSGEAYLELFSQLNDALLRFEEGPPFTLQRLCEILLDSKGTYTKLPKLGLALEKNLLVTSIMTKCADPYPAAHEPNSEVTAITENTSAVDVEPGRLPEQPVAVPNGTEHVGGDDDEEMADAEAEGLPGSHDVEMQEEKLDQTASINTDDTNSGAAITCETVNASDKLSDSQS